MGNIGTRIKEEREKQKIDREMFAEKLKVTYSTVAKWETNQKTPSLSNLITICEMLGVSLDYVVGRTEKISIGNNNKEYYQMRIGELEITCKTLLEDIRELQKEIEFLE